MEKYLRYPLFFALGWFVIKCILFFAGMEDSLMPGLLLNILFLLGSVAIGLFFKKKTENYADTNFLEDMKVGIKSGMVYVALLFASIYVFYAFIDPSYVEKIKENQRNEIESILETDEDLERVRSENENLRGLSREDIIDLQAEQAGRFVSPIFMATIALLSMMTGVFFNSLIVVFLFRRVLFRDMKIVGPEDKDT